MIGIQHTVHLSKPSISIQTALMPVWIEGVCISPREISTVQRKTANFILAKGSGQMCGRDELWVLQ